MDVLKFAADGGYRERTSTRDRAAAMSASRPVPTRKPVPGSRTVGRLKVRHYTQGLAHDPDADRDLPDAGILAIDVDHLAGTLSRGPTGGGVHACPTPERCACWWD